MNRINMLTALILGLLAITPSVNAAETSPISKPVPARADAAPIVSLAGKWRFALDRQGVGAGLLAAVRGQQS